MNFTDRSWMYDRHDHGKRSGQVKEVFKLGVELFITTVKQNPIVIREGGLRCPCAVCQCTRMGREDDIRKHLYRKGFQPNYWVWSSHGEGSTSAPVSFGRASTSRINEPVAVPKNYQHYDPFNEMNSMITNALGYNVPIYVSNDVHEPEEDDYDGDVQVERPNEEAERFYDLLQETNKPLFEGSLDSKLTVCIRLIGMKCRQVLEDTMDLITKLMLDVTLDHPKDLPKDYYEAKQLVAKLGL
ncbi:hypothetical protein TSUD_422620, partial [Trifolium subterraneum]